MRYRETEHLRVLIANERKDRLVLVTSTVANLGHEVIASEIEVPDVGVVTAMEQPDVALVGLGKSSEHALALIDEPGDVSELRTARVTYEVNRADVVSIGLGRSHDGHQRATGLDDRW